MSGKRRKNINSVKNLVPSESHLINRIKWEKENQFHADGPYDLFLRTEELLSKFSEISWCEIPLALVGVLATQCT